MNKTRDLPERKAIRQGRHTKSRSHPDTQTAQQPFNCSANQGAQHHADEETHPREKAEKPSANNMPKLSAFCGNRR